MNSEGKANVLLVDDRPENLLAMESILTGADYDLISATSAQEALRVLLTEDVALILLDVQMPGLNGFELAELIRERERTQHTPIIFVSATSVDEQYVFKGYSLGAVDYLTKPIQPEILKSKVNFFSRLYRQNQQIKAQSELLAETNLELDRLNTELEERVKNRTAALERANTALEMELEVKRQSEARLATEHSITRTLASAQNIEKAAPAILKTFCDNMEARVAALWLLDEAGEKLICQHVETPEHSDHLQPFIEATRNLTIEPGFGLPGHIWNSLEPVWFTIENRGEKFPRSDVARQVGLSGAVGLPIKVGSEFYGAIEFFTVNPLEARQRLINMFEVIGSEIGQFMYRKRVEADREALLSREKSLRQQAEKASRLKDEFLATVSHELRTPLNSILGWGQLLHMGKLDQVETKAALETIHRNARSQAQLIDDLLDTSRLITGNLQLDLSPTEIEPMIMAAIDMVRPAAESKGINISTRFESDTISITCDPQRLQQMVWNLLTNAVKFTPAGGQINISSKRGRETVEISVRDTGIGIAAEFLPFVFDRFRQEDSSSTRSHDGLGLGLAIVRHLAELHGGDIYVESDGPGKGACFTISLPRTLVVEDENSRHDDLKIAESTSNGNEIKLSGVRVLIVDDDLDACTMLEFALGASGAEVKTSLSVPEAFDRLESWTPHVLLTDINMPGEDGYSLINRLRKMDDTERASVPAIALTAMARPEDGERAMSAGFQLHIAKPVDIEELTKAISVLAERTS